MNTFIINLLKNKHFNKSFRLNLFNTSLFGVYALLFFVSLLAPISLILKVIMWVFYLSVLFSMHTVKQDLFEMNNCTETFGTSIEKTTERIHCLSFLILGFYIYKTSHNRYIIMPMDKINNNTHTYKVVNLVPNNTKSVGLVL